MNSGVLLKQRSRTDPSLPFAPPLVWRVMTVVGSVLAFIGAVDVTLQWYPARFGNVEWEFATSMGTFDALPLVTIGLLLVTLGAIALESRSLLILLAGALSLAVVAMLAVFILYSLSAVVAWQSIENALQSTLIRAVLKTSVLGVTYILLYGWLCWVAARAAGKLKGVPR